MADAAAVQGDDFKPFADRVVAARWPFGTRIEKALPAGLLVLFFSIVFVWALACLGVFGRRSTEGIALTTMLIATITSLSVATRRLPLQNVLLAAVVIAVLGGGMQLLGAATGIPFGAITYTGKAGWLLFSLLPWMMPLVWIVAVLNARGVARLILRPWRKTRTYGFRVIGLTCLLVVLFDFGLEPFACRLNRYWVWLSSGKMLSWHTAPWVNFLGWFLTTLLILAFATPALIKKKPVKMPPDYQPLALWLALNGLLAVAAGRHQLWDVVGLLAVANLAITIFAIRGARW